MWYNNDMMKKILLLLTCFGLLVIGFYFYHSNILRHQPTVNETFLSHQTIPASFDGIRIVHFSDVFIQNENDLRTLENAVDEINQLNPDIVVFTGNLFAHDIIYRETVIAHLLEINARLGRMATRGIHDSDNVIEILEAAAFTVLQNESIPLFNGTIDAIHIIGANPNLTRPELASILDEHHTADEFNLLLINEPTFAQMSTDFDIILQLSGYCLGLQQDGACAQFYDGLYQFSDIFTLNVSPGLSRNLSFDFSIPSRPRIDSFLLGAQ